MVIPPGGSEGGPGNRHRGSDQWLYVVAGTGRAIINGETFTLSDGSLVLIECGDKHEIRNTGRTPLQTLNWYLPPAYTKNGDPLPRGRK
jgi:mannose-6-phosphate isomerase-like protein (cupin superfamily)